ncbi:pseudaminic acid biosynthesis-associated methylase [Malaciobacter marinus]|uniref:pseudaminic acid biosynthesis-associated methylase n=1 Tax=Malaciobacter marinus TaxID=505249 RepID=UPI000C073178|nr:MULTISPECIES: pseudaminic acid biosynthesis-associated methylase [Malaciobacter]PHO13399.1 pseudaminic acid biosynthesis-associated methylase [Malaciobacter marinus]RYA24618.1 pseudaminic acid biosynthesis-associated methylase [Malaciobacter halophilus]
MNYKTEQENFWASSEWGKEYIQRNGKELIKNNINFFSNIIRKCSNITSIIEFGANIGLNLHALDKLFNKVDINAIEINNQAVEELKKLDFVNNIYHESILEFETSKTWDLVLIKTVLIHINPKYLDMVYEKLYKASNRYILIAEYYNPTPVEVNYRGHEGKLFKRDFAGELLDKYENLHLVDYGFTYHRDNNFQQDDISWFLLEKR